MLLAMAARANCADPLESSSGTNLLDLNRSTVDLELYRSTLDPELCYSTVDLNLDSSMVDLHRSTVEVEGRITVRVKTKLGGEVFDVRKYPKVRAYFIHQTSQYLRQSSDTSNVI